MRCATWLFLLAGLGITVSCANLVHAADSGKGVVVSLDGLKATTPGDWKEEKTASAMRLTQFRLPGAKGAKADAELVVFRNAGGSVRDNVARWKRQWKPPEGKTLDDVAKVEEIKIGGNKATLFAVEGTYLPPPFNPTYKGKPQPDFKMIAVQFKGPENLYHLILTGPAKTIDQHKKGFEDWLKAFK